MPSGKHGLSDLLWTSGVAPSCEAFAALDFHRGLCFLDRDRGLSVFRDVSDLHGKYPLVLCFRCACRRDYYLLDYSKVDEKSS